jgi:hypothetical protein
LLLDSIVEFVFLRGDASLDDRLFLDPPPTDCTLEFGGGDNALGKTDFNDDIS